MDTFGERLRSSREKKGYSLEQVARDTNIAKKFLIALEEEDFSIFPGEPYLIGFLKNYSEYLGLDSGEIVALHRNMKLQEQPVPLEALLDSGKPGFPIILWIIIAIAVLGAGGYFLYSYISKEPVEPVIETVEAIVKPVDVSSYDITDGDVEDRFPEGHELQLQFNGDIYNILVLSVTTNVILSLPGGEVMFNLGDEKESDLNGDGVPDISLVVNDIDINKKTAFIKLSLLKIIVEDSDLTETPESGSSNIASRNRENFVIMDAQNPESFVIDVVFRGNTFLRYLVDKGERIEKYFDKGDTLRLDINREVMLWVSNAGSFRAKISGIEVSLGQSGEVSTQLIKWTKSSDTGKYELQMIPVY